ncbi:trimethylamine methyltransferase family protein [Thermacetogenium phaeum]|uniref:trimethylamine methyltransferase family protein n=1 Tax=Thermacetogenium phaeum TaxID=85874 RepID=UPI0002F4241A|nr:trimethylamine methyltransferase family protein [Thermacetogenium phaeum]
MRTEFYYPRVATRTNYETWEAAGGKDTWTKAEEEARKILENHRPQRLPDDVVARIMEMEPGIIAV